jgi:hypothetical protein
LKLAGLAVASGFALVLWLRAPVLDTVGIQGWRAIGLVGAGSIGGIGVLMVRSWARVGVAIAIGLLAGAAWAEFRFSDVSVGLSDGVAAALVIHGRAVLLPSIAAALIGAVAMHVVSRKRRVA